MSTVRKFEHNYMKFAKGGLDEKLYYDRYSTPEQDIDKINVGDTVICKLGRTSDKRIVGEVVDKSNKEKVVIDTRTLTFEGLSIERKEFHHELITKPLDTEPSHFWSRWAKAGASVEKESKQEQIENEFRWLMDGFKFSAGGRIQLMAGQEWVTGKKANLTAFNCFVIPSPEYKAEDWDKAITEKAYAKMAMLAVVDNAINEAQIMARGGGVGYNASTIPSKIMGAGTTKEDIILYLPETHKDYDILIDLSMLGKFDDVKIITTKEEYEKYSKQDDTFIHKIHDSREGLLNGTKIMVEKAYDGIKVLLDFSNIRHKGALVKGVNGRSSGSPSWMVLFNRIANLLHRDFYDAVDTMDIQSEIVKLIEQGGSRRGALMIVLNANHPNIEKFIQRKLDKGFIEGANISVGVTKDFMEKSRTRGTKEAKIWNLIMYCAWKCAEPGILFIEYANEESNTYYYCEVVATNPCGEQPLPPWGVCNLGHVVLSRFYNPLTNDVDWEQLKRAIKAGIRFQDNMIDYTDYFMEENKDQQLGERRVGLGTMGLATLLIKMGIAYGSEESLPFIEKLFKFIAVESYKTSIDLAEEKGKFPKCEPIKMSYSGFMRRLLPELPNDYQEKFYTFGIRNATLLTQAPTGSTGTAIDNLLQQYVDGTSTGIEPYFAFTYWRASRSGEAIEQRVPLIDKIAIKLGKSIKDIPFLVTAQDLTPKEHIYVQATIQKWVDSAISKTANCPSDFTIEDTVELYNLAYDLDCKGVTIYRDGCREAQVLSTNKEGAKLEGDLEQEELMKLKSESGSEVTIKEDGSLHIKGGITIGEKKDNGIKKRPTDLPAIVRKVKYQMGNTMTKAYVTVCWDEEGRPIEVFILPTEESEMSMAFALSRLTTQFLRFGVTTDNVEQTLKHLKKGQSMLSLPSQVARLISDIVYQKIEVGGIKKQEGSTSPKLAECKSCGNHTYDRANCICHSCGVSSCN